MEFIETPLFTKQINKLLPDDDYKSLQDLLIMNPEAGSVIRGSGGLRKVRWSLIGKGKSSGIRAIYYHITADHQIYFLTAYAKNQQENLSDKELMILSKLVKEHFS